MKQFIELTGEEINALGNEGYRLVDVKPATAANTVVLIFKADGKEDLEYSAVAPANCTDVITECIGKEPVDVFVKIWNYIRFNCTH